MKILINKWKKIPNSAKSSIAFVFCSLFVKGFIFIVTPLFTRIMTMDDYGIVTTYNSWVSILEIFAILGLTSAGVFNIGLKDNKNKRDEYISSCLGLCNITTFIVFALILIGKVIFGNDFILSNKLLLCMFVHFLFNPAQIFWITRQRYEYKYKLATLVSIVSVVVAQLFSVVSILVFDGDVAFNKIMSNELGLLVFTIPIYIILLKKGKDYINLKRWKSILYLAIPLIPHYLAQHVMASSDKIMISNFVSSGDAAIYGVVANISMIGTIFWNAINASLIPYTHEKIETKKYNHINALCKKLLIGYFVVQCLILLIAPEILSILAPPSYSKGVYCIPPLIFVIYLNALYNMFANIEFYHKKTKGIAVSTVIAAAINLILNYIFIPYFSYVAAAYTTMISNVVLVFLHYLFYKKTETNNVYDISFILKISIFQFLFSGLCNFLYFNSLIRYLFIILIIIIIICKRKNIIETIKTLKSS